MKNVQIVLGVSSFGKHCSHFVFECAVASTFSGLTALSHSRCTENSVYRERLLWGLLCPCYFRFKPCYVRTSPPLSGTTWRLVPRLLRVSARPEADCPLRPLQILQVDITQANSSDFVQPQLFKISAFHFNRVDSISVQFVQQ